jgi:hypothetical protein
MCHAAAYERSSGNVRLQDRARLHPLQPHYRPFLLSAEEEDCDPDESGALGSALTNFFSGNDSQIPRIARFFHISRATVPEFRDHAEFVRFLAHFLANGEIWQLIQGTFILSLFVSDEAFDWAPLIHPDLILKVIQRIPMTEYCSEKVPYFKILTRLLRRYIESWPLFIECGYIMTLLTEIQWAATSDTAEIVNVSPSFIDLVHEFVSALFFLIDGPLYDPLSERLWEMAIALLRVEQFDATVGSLRAFKKLIKKGFPPVFNDETIAVLAGMAAQGETVLRPLFRMVLAVPDRDRFFKKLHEAGFWEKLLEFHIESCTDDSYCVYRFFTVAKFTPWLPVLLPVILGSLPEAPYRTQIAMVLYVQSAIEAIERDMIPALIESCMIEIVAQILTDDDGPETVMGCARLARVILMTAVANGIDIAQRFGFLHGAADEALGRVGEDADDCELKALLALFQPAS